MSYAIRNDGLGWRAVDDPDDVTIDETFSATLPALSIAQIKLAQIAIINDACQSQIFAGFISSALGAVHTYPARVLDQQNLSASVLASLIPGNASPWTTPFWCADAAGVWAYANHTASQIQQVGTDGKTAVTAALIKNATLTAQIMAATTIAAVQAVVW